MNQIFSFRLLLLFFILMIRLKSVRTKHELNLQFDVPENTHSQLLPWHSSPQISHIVHFLILQNFSDHVSCWNSLGSFGSNEFVQSLRNRVCIINTCSSIWSIIVTTKVNLLILNKFYVFEDVLSEITQGALGNTSSTYLFWATIAKRSCYE